MVVSGVDPPGVRSAGNLEPVPDKLTADSFAAKISVPWVWGGFGTQDLKRTAIMARLNAPVYNWWSLDVRMIDSEARREAQTSRSPMMDEVARVTSISMQDVDQRLTAQTPT